MKITLRRAGVLSFEARNDRGDQLTITGSAEMRDRVMERVDDVTKLPAPNPSPGGEGMRPTELFLASLASCGAMDIVVILTRQRQPLTELAIEAIGQRREEVPSIFTDIELRVTAPGVDEAKLARAAELSIQKYCSVRSMIGPDTSVRITMHTNSPKG